MRWLALWLMLVPLTVFAEEARPLAENPVVEARLKKLAVELRCLVCQNQTLADSNAPLAEDLRREVREMIVNNMTDDQIVEFLVARYGDFVRYRPPFKVATVLLWVGPFLLLGIGGIVLIVSLRQRNLEKESSSISDDDRQRVARLLRGEGGVNS
ncbi:cytochrome c-type biogenesis protein [Petrachloros mirabilis]